MDWKGLLGWSELELDDLRFVGYSYLRDGLYDTALTFFSALVEIDPQNPYDYQMLGALHLQRGNGMQALEALERALQIDPTQLGAQLNRAKALLLLGYKRQGLLAAKELETCLEPEIATQASALLLAYK